MQLVVLDHQELPCALRAFREVMLAKGPLTPKESEFLAQMRRVNSAEIDLDALRPITPEEVASAIRTPEKRTWVLQFSVVAATIPGEVTRAQLDVLKRLDATLRVNEPILSVLEHIVRGQRRRATLFMAKRIFSTIWRSAYRQGGLRSMRQAMGPFTNGYDDPEVAWKFKQLGLLPEGTVGRALWEHYVAFRRLFPGERGSKISERMIFHDIGHILAGYDTDDEGEIRQGFFQAGYIREDGFVQLMFTIMQWHLGFRLSAVTKATRDLFNVADLMRAFERGAACKVDLFADSWNHWDVVTLTIEEFRASYGVPPLQPVAPAA